MKVAFPMLSGKTMKQSVRASALLAVAVLCGQATAILAQDESGDRNRFGNWSLQCSDAIGDARECWLSQILIQQEGQRFLAEVRIGTRSGAASSRYVMLIHVPPPILLTVRSAFRVDEDLTDYPMIWRSCTANRCTAAVTLDQASVDRLRSGLRMITGYQALSAANPSVFEVSLVGVTTGLRELDRRISGD